MKLHYHLERLNQMILGVSPKLAFCGVSVVAFPEFVLSIPGERGTSLHWYYFLVSVSKYILGEDTDPFHFSSSTSDINLLSALTAAEDFDALLCLLQLVDAYCRYLSCYYNEIAILTDLLLLMTEIGKKKHTRFFFGGGRSLLLSLTGLLLFL